MPWELGVLARAGGRRSQSQQPWSPARSRDWEGRRRRREDEDAPEARARRGRAFGWKWGCVSSGKAGPSELFGRLSSFEGARPRAPQAAAAPGANEWRLANLERERTGDRNCGRGRPAPKFTFFF